MFYVGAASIVRKNYSFPGPLNPESHKSITQQPSESTHSVQNRLPAAGLYNDAKLAPVRGNV